MDGKTKFLVSVVILGALYGIGMAYYKYIVLKDIQLYYLEEEGEEELQAEDESAMESEEALVDEEQGVSVELEDKEAEISDGLLDIEATTTATTTLGE